jgi:hypothetical protein
VTAAPDTPRLAVPDLANLTAVARRTIPLPPFLVTRLRDHLATGGGPFVFTSPRGYPLRRSTFDRRVFRPAVDGNPRKGTQAVQPGLRCVSRFLRRVVQGFIESTGGSCGCRFRLVC